MSKDSKMIKTMDGDCEKQDSDPLPSIGNFLQSSWLRFPSKMDDRIDRWLLAWNFRILPIISGVFYLLLLVIKN